MNAKEFREFGYAAVDFIADYMENVHERQVLPSVEPGYLHNLLPSGMPEKSESWKNVMKDLNDKILPGITHWQSPNFHAYYPSQSSYPSIVGDMIANGLGTVSFSWICSPAVTELEVIVVDWLAKFLDLPAFFLNSSDGCGGGMLQGTASESMLVAILTARDQAVARLKIDYPNMNESDIRGKLVMYTSDQGNSCVEKTARLAAVSIRLLPVNRNLSLCGKNFRIAIEDDIKVGKFPFACVATLGTTGTCAFDNLLQIGPLCRENKIWLHIDAAYAGSALCCPEFRPLMQGIEYADSFNFNLHKWMMVNFDCSAMWFRDTSKVVDAFTVDRIYLRHHVEIDSKAPEYRNWEIPLGHRFRALKVWFTLRIMGAEEIRENIRNHVRLAGYFAELIATDTRFEIIGNVLGLVCFRLKRNCEYTKRLVNILTERKNIYVIQALYHDKIIIRFVVNGLKPTEKDIEFAWNEIRMQTNEIFKEISPMKIEISKSKCLIDFGESVQVASADHLFAIK
ncbi:3,4-dihydroxyphenylacetaldehyde synthase 2-like [Contarinia nasturtii]|uniref:3,4-dihydroxyphenylacetaldehyde synthase 2-like n=1 Tax=Contarinia nasturtii TaxID=265458 RepID=UPI0012D3B42E|nr:3,4-dihydroxyphenylacetaldehyde synthase 2-like [Contarinia nasturtii]